MPLLRGKRKSPGPQAPTSVRKIMLAAILDALAEGPATAHQIEALMGFTYCDNPSETTSLLYRHEHKGLVRRVGRVKASNKRGPGQIVWALA